MAMSSWGDSPNPKVPPFDKGLKVEVEKAVLDVLKANGPMTAQSFMDDLLKRLYPTKAGMVSADMKIIGFALRHHEKLGTIKVTADASGKPIYSLS